MRYTLRTKRVLVGTAAGAMVLGMLPGAAFADRAAVCANAEEGVFNDVPTSNVHSDNIDCVAAYDITTGVGGGNYAPRRDVRRDQMATFLVNLGNAALAGEFDAADGSPFTDIAGNIHEDNIEIAYEQEITTGTSVPTLYAPRAFVTRAQMATFVVNTISAAGYDIPAADGAFTDTAGNVHEDNINRLADTGVVLGRTATTYEPNALITRDQMATFLANAAGLLDEEGFWNAPRLPGDELVFRALAIDTAENEVLLSTGEAVVAFDYTGDAFQVNGANSSEGAFENFVNNNAPQVTLTATEQADGSFVHNVVEADLVLSGVVGNNDGSGAEPVEGDNTAFAIVDAPSGENLTNITEDLAGLDGDIDVTYTVDGRNVGGAAFLRNLSIGDTITANILSTNAAGDPTAIRHDLVNGTLEGEVVLLTDLGDVDGLPAVVDPNSDDDGDLDNVLLYTTDDGDEDGVNYVFEIDGATADDNDVDFDVNDFDAAVAVGMTLTYEFSGGTATYTVDTDPQPKATVEGLVIDGDFDNDVVSLVVSTSATASEPFDVSADATVIIGGVVSTYSELQDAVSIGDTVVYQPKDEAFDTDESITLTAGAITNVRVIGWNAETDVAKLLLANGFELDLDVTDAPFGVEGDALYRVNGTTRSEPFFLSALDNTNLVTNDVRLSLDEGLAASHTWSITGVPASAITAATAN